MTAEFFLDTSVFVNTFDATSPAKRRRARALVRRALEAGVGVISWQVAQEFVNVALHRFEDPLTPGEAAEYVEQVLSPLCRVFPSPDLLVDALAIHSETGLGVNDALIVAGALASGVRTLYSEGLLAGREFRGLRVENPFA
jgi:predicted nucleic acid-binding protein